MRTLSCAKSAVDRHDVLIILSGDHPLIATADGTGHVESYEMTALPPPYEEIEPHHEETEPMLSNGDVEAQVTAVYRRSWRPIVAGVIVAGDILLVLWTYYLNAYYKNRTPRLNKSVLSFFNMSSVECGTSYELVKNDLKPVKELNWADEQNSYGGKLTCADGQGALHCYNFGYRTPLGPRCLPMPMNNDSCVIEYISREVVGNRVVERFVDDWGGEIPHTNSTDKEDIVDDIAANVIRGLTKVCEWRDDECSPTKHLQPAECQCDFTTLLARPPAGLSGLLMTMYANMTKEELKARVAARNADGYTECWSACYELGTPHKSPNVAAAGSAASLCSSSSP